MNDKLSQAMDHISDRHLSEAAAPVRHRYYPYLGAIAAVLALVLTASFLFAPSGQFFVPTPTTTAPILQNPTHSCHPTTTPTHPSTIPSTQPSTIPSTPSSSVPTSSTISTQPSSTQTPTTITLSTNKTVYFVNEDVHFTISSPGTSNTLRIYRMGSQSEDSYPNINGNSFTISFSSAGGYTALVETQVGTNTLTSSAIYFSVERAPQLIPGDPCAEGHSYAKRLNGRCVLCYAKDPNYDPCADGHNFQDYYCTDCGFRHRCADGHSYKDGRCTWCGAPDPAVIVPAIVSVDKSIYTTGEPVCFNISPSDTTYRLTIRRVALSFTDDQWTQRHEDVGASFTLTFDQPGRYEVSVAPISTPSNIQPSSWISFAIVNPCPKASGHTFDRGYCTICAEKDYLYDFCIDCSKFFYGFCTDCGATIPMCREGHIYSVREPICVVCGFRHPACYYGHTFEDGFCVNCGIFDPSTDPCANGHTFKYGRCIYCDIVDPCANGHTFKDSCCIKCGISMACYHGMHRYENGSCANCQTKETFAQDAKLIVNGKDITVGNYAKILVPEGGAWVPLTATLTELGIPWEWESDTVLRFGSGDSVQIIDLTLPAYNFPIRPGALDAVRKVVGDEIIVDIASLSDNLLRSRGISFMVEHDTRTIYIGV